MRGAAERFVFYVQGVDVLEVWCVGDRLDVLMSSDVSQRQCLDIEEMLAVAQGVEPLDGELWWGKVNVGAANVQMPEFGEVWALGDLCEVLIVEHLGS